MFASCCAIFFLYENLAYKRVNCIFIEILSSSMRFQAKLSWSPTRLGNSRNRRDSHGRFNHIFVTHLLFEATQQFRSWAKHISINAPRCCEVSAFYTTRCKFVTYRYRKIPLTNQHCAPQVGNSFGMRWKSQAAYFSPVSPSTLNRFSRNPKFFHCLIFGYSHPILLPPLTS